MKVGYVYNPARLAPGDSYGNIVKEIRAVAEMCDTAGFDSFWFSEHHFGFWDRTPLPNPVLMGADIAARTKQIRIGFASVTIPFWNPIRLAEDVALLDHLSDGRVELGVGRGNYPVEAFNLNPGANPKVPEENYKYFEETLNVLKLAFTQKYWSFKGEKYTYPFGEAKWDRVSSGDSSEFIDPETKVFTKLALMPRPVQQPHPPIWQMVDDPRSVAFAAQNGLKVMMWRPSARKLAHHRQLYCDAARAVGREVPPGTGLGILRDTFVADTMEQARELAGKHVMQYLNFTNWRGPTIYIDPDEVIDPALEAALKRELTYEWVHPRSLLFGTPEHVLEKLQELEEVGKVEHVVLTSAWGVMDRELTRRSLRLFADKVLPRLK